MARASEFSLIMRRFLDRVGLISLWEKFPIDYTHMHTDFKSTSVIDHFRVNERLVPLVKDCGPIHLGDNRSRHSPIMVKLDLGSLPLKQKVKIRIPRKPAWDKASMDDIMGYTEQLDHKIQNIAATDSINCSNVNCNDVAHSSDRDDMVLDILMAIVETSHATIPKSGGGRAKSGAKYRAGSVPGWKEEAEYWGTVYNHD